MNGAAQSFQCFHFASQHLHVYLGPIVRGQAGGELPWAAVFFFCARYLLLRIPSLPDRFNSVGISWSVFASSVMVGS